MDQHHSQEFDIVTFDHQQSPSKSIKVPNLANSKVIKSKINIKEVVPS